ncbi:hypothetical protein D2E33_16520 [Mycobacteroides abscessus]|nr:hypothetical protein [Mycobacteroides abscessus]WJJ56009.1 hypothetical protein PROPHIT491_73 [Mycobacterium phage prophiT49-1]SKS04612.1 Uncharacterised protein [Mycobacteroides abscessus subsp. abscessus]NOS13746.1 hypothetical protein [Mycobacteroides abscessus]NOS19834.1 hypothetical protein [Mycobacteroides abscessus]
MSTVGTAGRYPAAMDGYLRGSVKIHPDYPENPTIALRSVFDDDDATGCNSWLVVSASSGALYRTESFVADWPDADGLTLTTTLTPAP